MRRRRHYLTLVVCVALVGVARLARADGATQYTYQVLFDTDNNPATGCGVAVHDTAINTTVAGVERLVTVTVSRTGAAGMVTGITAQSCVSGTTFGAPQMVSPGGWPVGDGNGVGGADVIEGLVPIAVLGNAGVMRVAFTATRSGMSDVMLSTTGALGGAPILLRLQSTSTSAPLLSPTGLALSILLLGGVAWWGLRRRLSPHQAFLLALAVTAGVAATAYALTITLDGQVGDWGALPPAAMDPSGDSTNHDPAEDLVAGFLTADNTNVYFRLDVVTIADLCAGVVCTASDQCHAVGTCDLYTGQCSNPAKTDGTACDDNSACTSGEACHSGVCGTPTSTVSCTASDQCHTAGTCNTGTGVCSNPAKTDGTACDDANACTSGEACHSGVCSTPTSTVSCTASDQCHTAGTCNTGTGVCSNPAKTDGTLCNDANACTSGEACHSGVCGTPTSTVSCTASDQCHTAGTCNTGTGVCSNPAKADGTPCDDTNACTSGEACYSGVCGTPTSTKPDGTTCDAGTDSTQTKICVSAACGACTAFAPSPRFVDNGDGTITDRQTCLVWEQKTTTVGSGVNFADPHDVDNSYNWSTGTNNPDGTAFTNFLATLNAGAGFAGHKDWRLPSEDGQNTPGGPKELESILAAPFPCGTNPCINAAFGPTQSYYYWSATTLAGGPSNAWGVGFGNGGVGFAGKTFNGFYVRAVRSGL